jgi:hypothetical protein
MGKGTIFSDSLTYIMFTVTRMSFFFKWHFYDQQDIQVRKTVFNFVL